MKILVFKAHHVTAELLGMTIQPEEIELKFYPTQVITITTRDDKEYPLFQTIVSLQPSLQSYALNVSENLFKEKLVEAVQVEENERVD